MPKIDLRKELRHLYNPSLKGFAIVEVPPLNFLMLDGRGDPNTAPVYVEALQALYGLSYTVKFTSKKKLGIDYTVMALEGLWWADDMDDFLTPNKDCWQWTMMMLQPEHISADMLEEARAEVARRRGDSAALAQARLERFHEGLSVQIMYLGAYADEGPTILRMHEFIRENGYVPSGKHHEIYLGDPRRTAPEKLKTVIRQPVRQA